MRVQGRGDRPRGTETPSERKVRVALQRAGLPFEQEARIGHYTVDFCVGSRVVIEVDGLFHYTQQAQASDKERDKVLEDLGYVVFRVTNDEVRSSRRLKSLIAEIRNELVAQRSAPAQDRLTNRPFDEPALRELMTQIEEETEPQSQVASTRKQQEKHLTDRELFEKWIAEMTDAPDGR